MGFLLDSLKHLFASDPQARRDGLAGLAGRLFGTEGNRLGHRTLPAERDFDVWHFRKAGARNPRGYAASLTLGLADSQQRELVALTLGDSRTPEDDRVAALLGAVAAAGTPRGSVVGLPEATLGRSSHTHALITAPWPLPEQDLPEYERVLGARLDLVVPVTAREADWIAAHSAGAYVAAMVEQGVSPWADRAPGETTLFD